MNLEEIEKKILYILPVNSHQHLNPLQSSLHLYEQHIS